MKKKSRAAKERLTHYRLMRRIYTLCRSGEWTVRYAAIKDNRKVYRELGVGPNTVGSVSDVTKVITIDFREDIIATFVHECLHVILDDRFQSGEEDAEELEVQRLEKLMMRRMTALQATRLHRMINEMLA